MIELINKYLKKLFPINRSITGSGNRETLKILNDLTGLKLSEIASGTKVFDWTVPDEWHVHDAWVKDSSGNKIIDFKLSNLHVMSYSCPTNIKISFEDLKKHLHYLEAMPNAIPYKTSYYKKDWAFCISYNDYKKMKQDEIYEVYIDSGFNKEGSLTYAEAEKKGTSGKSFLISTYICHPSLANDNLSGLLLSVLLFKMIEEMDTRHTYRLLIAPETIGAISYLCQKGNEIKDFTGGYIPTCVAGPGKFGYKSSFMGDSEVDQAAKYALQDEEFILYPFEPKGSDERQFSSPAFKLAVGSITKDKYYEYDEYHTSQDNLDYISAQNLYKTLNIYRKCITLLEKNLIFKRTNPHCEDMLSKYDLYPDSGGQNHNKINDSINWLMHACDGERSIFEISRISGISPSFLYETSMAMKKAGLLEIIND